METPVSGHGETGSRPDAGVGVNRRTRRAVLMGAAGAALSAGVALKAQPASAATAFTSDQIDLMLKTLANAPNHGFRRDEFGPPDLADQVRGGKAAGLLSSAVLAYARAQRGQRIALGDFPQEWAVRPAPYDPAPEFAAAAAQDRLGPWLDSLPPPYQGYAGLQTALAQYRDIAGRHGWKTLADGAPLNAGVTDPRVAALRTRLAVEDDDTPDGGDTPEVFDADLTPALIRFQRRHGLVPDGVAGPPTLEALNMPVGQRILQIEANMERWRWMPRKLPPTRVQVNIAAAVMAVYRDDQPALAMKAVSGRPDDATPMLTSQIQSIVFNPPWHVPTSIAQKEIWPKAHRDKGYLARNQYEVKRLDDGALHLVQKAGPKSALGRFKFDFPNPFGVYLHDTPAQASFSRTNRLASHGCVRLEHPEALANLLLEGDANWSPDRVQQIVTTDETQRAPLPSPIPVFILYWTAFVDGAGHVEFRGDAYDWDRKLLNLVGASRTRA